MDYLILRVTGAHDYIDTLLRHLETLVGETLRNNPGSVCVGGPSVAGQPGAGAVAFQAVLVRRVMS